jgi:hypothetical protein
VAPELFIRFYREYRQSGCAPISGTGPPKQNKYVRAQDFLADMEGRREMIESEPGVYRHTEVSGDGFKAFSLTSLLPKTGFDVHVAKMAE